MSYRTHLHRSLAALPLLGLAVAACLLPPPSVPRVIEQVVSAGLACETTAGPVGPRGLARMPGDLGLLARRLNCVG